MADLNQKKSEQTVAGARAARLDAQPSAWLPTRGKAVRIGLWYAALTALWTIAADWLPPYFTHDPAALARFNKLADGIFLVATTLLLIGLLNRYCHKICRQAQQLQDGEARLRMVGDNLPDSFVYQYTHDAGGRPKFIYISQGVRRVLGWTVAEVLQDASCLFSQIDPAQMPAYAVAERESARQLTDFEFVLHLRRADGAGRLLQLRSRPRRDEHGLVHWDGLATDITESRQAELAVQKSEAKWRSYIENAPVGVLVVDENGRPMEANRAAEDMLGYEPGGLLRTRVTDIPAPEDDEELLRRHLARLETMGRADGEFRLRRQDGRDIWALVRASRLTDGRRLAVMQDISERKQAEADILANRAQLLAALASMSDAVFISDAQGKFIEFNHAFATFHKFDSKDQCAKTLAEYPEILEVFMTNGKPAPVEKWAASRALRGETGANVEYFLRRKDTGVTWAGSYNFAPVRDPAGVIIGSVVVGRDITEQKRAERNLRESEEQFRAMFETTSIGMADADPFTGRFIRVNRKMCEITGYSEGELLALNKTEITHPDDHERDREFLQRIVRGEIQSYHTEKRYRRKNREVAWVSVHVTAIRNPAGQPVRLMAAVEDITERRRTDEILRLQSAALEAAANTIVITDRQGRIEWVNRAFTGLTGYTPAEVIGRNLRLLKSSKHEAAYYQNLWQTVLAGRIWRDEIINRRKDGSLCHEDMTITPLRDAAGDISHFIAIRQDITARKQLEAQYQQAQKLEAIGQLAGGVAHDYNNILTSTMMQLELLLAEESLSPGIRGGLQNIHRDAERAAHLTRQLLLFSRKQVWQPRHLNLNDAIAQTARMLQRIIGENIRLQLSLHPGPLTIHADPGMIDQVLMNLSVNSRDAMPDGGYLTIGTAEKNVDEAAAQNQPDAAPGRYACLSVTDTGTGIAPEILPRIFEPFFTTKATGKGTGLGLATVFGIAKQHRGWVTVDSRPGGGTTFQIFLPASDATAVAALDETHEKPKGGTETILFTEDDPFVQATTKMLLKRNGYQVLSATNGREALKVWAEQRDSVALLLTDLVMPSGMTGQQLAQQLRADKPDLKIVYISGYSVDIAGQEIKLQPGECFLHKPFQPDDLLAAIRKCLDG